MRPFQIADRLFGRLATLHLF